MTSKEFNNEKLYQTTMSLMRSLLMQGAITQKEYCRIDTIFLEKYRFRKVIFGYFVDF